MAYYIAIDGVQQGPFALRELTSKPLRGDTLVWTEGLPDWKRADTVPELAPLLAPPPADQSTIPQTPPGNPFQAVLQTPPANPYQAVPTQAASGMLSYNTPQPAPSNGFAIASMVLGIAAYPMSILISCMGVIPALLAIIFGFLARAKIKRGEVHVGAGMALAGIILGFVYLALGLIFAVVVIFIVAASSKSRP